MEDQAYEGPPGNQLQSDVRPPQEEAPDQNDHVGITPCSNQPELAVDWLPNMDLHAAETLDREPFDDPLREITSDNRPKYDDRINGLERPTIKGEPMLPSPPPKRRVHQVDSMIEHIAPF